MLLVTQQTIRAGGSEWLLLAHSSGGHSLSRPREGHLRWKEGVPLVGGLLGAAGFLPRVHPRPVANMPGAPRGACLKD